MFNIVNVKQDNAVWTEADGKPMVFMTGKEAADYCATTNARYTEDYYRTKLQPRRVADDGSWQARERERFTSGKYVALPWVSLPWFERPETALHFAHVSTTDGAKVAYTDDAVKGATDRQTRIKPGKYLAKFYSDVLTTEDIARLSAEFSKTYETNALSFAKTQDDWEDVYTRGPSSCMSHAAHSYAGSMHPVRVYAAGDLELAYLERDGDITARAIVWPDKKVYTRIYGDAVRLESLLEDAGYVSGSIVGAKLLRVECRGGFVMPYIDYVSTVRDAGEHIVIDEGGYLGCDNTNGLSSDGEICARCGCHVDGDDCRYTDDGYYCDDCYSEEYSYCEYYEEDYPHDGFEEVIVFNGRGGTTTQMWSEMAVRNHAFYCPIEEKAFSDDLAVNMANGETWSQRAFEERGFVCDGNGDNYPSDDMVTLADGTQWSKDHFAKHGVEVDGKFYDKDDAPQEDADDAVEGGVA